ncbi:putative RNA polymerase sigma factor [Actinokineospora spheciospongiae]|uniref:Putative RNA polymerase sigma factor n=1 Tax=Actinokineospora spheciospongiae TaxID=909613 RepID=W7ID68_9PSEU|nr:sigma-70 family RNA polymerase sigma factor [Actinokineospora spheciospongiae]EWC58508.1 putative RNA polymerase sigma factor [Actinokineospora spheciospongiae]PWW64112.1 RNA polymerase sigma factor (sigma-70 family) [Actinokineospora spheciospongiae]
MRDLVALAAGGDQDAWRELVRRYSDLVWAVARAHRLQRADAADVSQLTWVRLAENIGRLREPDRVGAWLATTARRESLRVLGERGRETVTDRWAEWVDGDETWRPEEVALRGERDDLLWRAFAGLRERCRNLLALQSFAPELTYVELSGVLGLSGSAVSKTRGRCLEALRRRLVLLGVPGEAA